MKKSAAPFQPRDEPDYLVIITHLLNRTDLSGASRKFTSVLTSTLIYCENSSEMFWINLLHRHFSDNYLHWFHFMNSTDDIQNVNGNTSFTLSLDLHILGNCCLSWMLLNSQGGLQILLAGRAGCASGWADSWLFSCVCGVLLRSGICEVVFLWISSSVPVLVAEGLGGKNEQDRSAGQWREEEESSDTMVASDRVKNPRRMPSLNILCQTVLLWHLTPPCVETREITAWETSYLYKYDC